jgi:UDP-glucose 4-epimerase
LDAGHEVHVFDNLSSGLKQNLFPEAGFTQGDILNTAELDAFFSSFKPEGLVHLAAFKSAGESMTNPEK